MTYLDYTKDSRWFYIFNDDTALKHRAAYEKSLTSKSAVKVHAGTYYYRGYEISDGGCRDYPWSYNRPEDSDFDREWAPTKREAMEYIDDILKEA